MKRKKSKAQSAYERLRKNIQQNLTRAQKRGSRYWFDLPETPQQMLKRKGEKATAASYREATKELKQLNESLKNALKYEREQAENVEILDASEIVVQNFLDEIKDSKGAGAMYISGYVASQVSTRGAEAVAEAINAMAENGYLIGKAERYNMKYAIMYVASFGKYLRDKQMVTTDEWLEMEAEFEMDSWEVYPEELQ